MNKLFYVSIIFFSLTCSLLFFNCCGSVQEQNVTVVGSILGEDGAYTPVPPVDFVMTHSPAGTSSGRVLDASTGIQNQQAARLTVQRTGIPLIEEYWFMNLSRLEPRPGSEDESPIESSGNFNWIRTNVGDLSLLGLRPDMIDSPLLDSLSFEPTSFLRLTGNSYLCRVQEADIIISFQQCFSSD